MKHSASLPKALLCGALVGLAASSAYAGSAKFDFSSDPAAAGLQIFGPNAPDAYVTTGGNPGGYLSINNAVNSSGATIIFPDFDKGLVVTSFKFSVDLRVGNGIGNGGRPADGFAISYARSNDPLIVNADGSGHAAGLPETGSSTGIAVSFDAWSGNTLPDTADIEGIIVRVDNVTVNKTAMPTRNGSCTDITSQQTGPYNAATDGSPDGLCWAKLEVELDSTAKLTVKWKGATLLNKFQTTYFPSPGQLVLSGRTGGANQNVHVDNIAIDTVGILDKTAPTAAKNLAATLVGAQRVALKWDAATDDSNLVSYDVFRNGTQVATFVQGTSYTDTTVSPNTSYSYTVVSSDPSNNKGPATAALAVKTASEVEAVGFVKAEYFRNIAGTTVDALQSADAYIANTPTDVRTLAALEVPINSDNNYGVRVSGWITPTETANYVFYMSADDGAQLWLSSDDKPANLTQIASEPTWNGARDWLTTTRRTADAPENVSAPIRLTAGKKYYFEGYMKEGGGGDNFAATWIKEGATPPASGSPALSGPVLSGLVDGVGTSVKITTQPKDTTTAENVSVSFTVAADIVSPAGTATLYQWYQNDKPIAGANGTTYTIPFPKAADSGAKFKVLVAQPGATETSATVTLTVNAETTKPRIASASGNDQFNAVTVKFSEPVTAATAGTLANYTIAGLTISAVKVIDSTTVKLTTAAQTGAQAYVLTVKNVADTATTPNVIDTASGGTVKFYGWVLTSGVAKVETYQNINGGSVANLTDSQKYIDGQPDTEAIVGSFVGPTDTYDNYGTRIRAFVTPPATGNYVFYMSSDDNGQMWLSTDDKEANKVQIASEPTWNGARDWNGTARRNADRPENYSDPIRLEKGKSYYLEVLAKEGGGGDNSAATVVQEGTKPVNGETLLTGAWIQWYSAPPFITKVQGSDTHTNVFITFSTPVNTAAGTAANYTIAGLTVTGATMTDSTHVRLNTSAQTGGTSYKVVTANIPGLVANPADTAANESVSFVGWSVTKGKAMWEAYYNIGGGTVADLTNADKFKNHQPDEIKSVDSLDGPTNIAESYGSRTVAWITPPSSGDYEFYLSADDGTALYLSTDENPANKTQIASEPAWNGVRDWNTTARRNATTPENKSKAITLTAGKQYYIEILSKEGGGGDNSGATVVPAGTKPVNGETNLKGDWISYWAPGAGSPATGSKLTVATGAAGKVTISWTGTGTLQAADAVTGPWTDVAGATSPRTVDATGASKFYRIKQ